MNSNAGEETVSMLDVLEEDAALEEEANAVLGASDDQNCTYPNGYVDRQALYACMTCCGPESDPAGVCLACSLHCHEKHDLVELYTKRNFRCDCGNNKFRNFTCKLFKEKEDINSGNQYNQNFKGTYCTCKRPYPDDDDEVEDEMIQCIICEDWYHSRHLGVLPPADYVEMICDACVKLHDFLLCYKVVSVPSGMKTRSQQAVVKEETSEAVDVTGTTDANDLAPEAKSPRKKTEKASTSKDNTPSTSASPGKDACINKALKKGAGKQCKLESLKADSKSKVKPTALFWASRWRELLCRCEKCMIFYKDKGVAFLTEDSDTLECYEAKSKAKSQDSYGDAMSAIGSLGRVQQVEMVQGYNDMRSELTEYLKRFAEEGKVVTKEDIESFFEGLRARKRRRLEDGVGIQMNCR